jgi:peptide/nickel transport system ATP-binding protein
MEPLVETRNLKKYFKTPGGNLHAVDGLDLRIDRGQTLGVVGESGCGKSTLGRTILRLLEPTGGDILYEGKSILGYGAAGMRELRRSMQIIFQDPYSSLNPRMTVGEIIAEPLIVNKLASSGADLSEKVRAAMEKVELSRRLVNSYPHELDGGRRQRIGVARALSLSPRFIVCDEPVSALDVSVQAQILNLLMDLQDDMGLTYMFITHNLSVVKHIADEIAVMYLGRCVEKAPSAELFQNPVHPYTKALLGAIQKADLRHRGKKRVILRGEVTSPIDPKPGCRFEPRCPDAREGCAASDLGLVEISPGHSVACERAVSALSECRKGHIGYQREAGR